MLEIIRRTIIVSNCKQHLAVQFFRYLSIVEPLTTAGGKLAKASNVSADVLKNEERSTCLVSAFAKAKELAEEFLKKEGRVAVFWWSVVKNLNKMVPTNCNANAPIRVNFYICNGVQDLDCKRNCWYMRRIKTGCETLDVTYFNSSNTAVCNIVKIFTCFGSYIEEFWNDAYLDPDDPVGQICIVDLSDEWGLYVIASICPGCAQYQSVFHS